jgi:hypothetical protein
MICTRSQRSSGSPGEDAVNDLAAYLVDVLPEPRVPRIRGARTVTALFPDGRMAWLRLRPEQVQASEVNRLARSVLYANVRHAAVTRATALSIDRLSQTVRADAQRIMNVRLRSEHQVRRRIAAGDAKLDRTLDAASARARNDDLIDDRRLEKMAQALRRKDLWDSLVLVSSAPQFVAYGQPGDPFGMANVVLAISLAVWLVGDELLDFLTGDRRLQSGLLRDVDVWSYIAPFANLVTGWWLLRDQQHERLIVGVATFDATAAQLERGPFSLHVGRGPIIFGYFYTWRIDVAATHVAPDQEAEFRSYSDVVALASIQSWTPGPGTEPVIGTTTAAVSNGILKITVEVNGHSPTFASILTSLRVAWVIDTRPTGCPHG